MKFSRPEADVFLPAGGDAAQALARTTHLCVIAHQDDIEINAYPAVTECLGRADRFFTGVVMTNGAGSARTGKFAHVTDAQMQVIRRDEQRAAAVLGNYNLQLQLAHPSSDVKQAGHAGVTADLAAMGRRLANATFFNSHATDQTNAISLAMDLTPLVRDDTLSVREFALGHIDRLRADVAGRIAKFGG